ncbi:MAG: cytochrome c oxidase assembly protein [Telluria sp.]
MLQLSCLLLLLSSGLARAHDVAAPVPAPGWTFDPWVVALLALSLAWYAAGAWKLAPRMRQGRAQLVRQLGCFGAGWVALVVALVSPLDPAGTQSFAAHMVQHEVLMIVAAPLLVLARPLGTWLWALPPRARARLAAAAGTRGWQAFWRTLTRPLNAWLVHAAALWLWHAPPLFEAALRNNGLHALQHASFFVSALLFWWAVFGEFKAAQARGAAIAYLFTTMLHTGALGALLAMSGSVWYPDYLERAPELGLSALEDLQLGGLIMWVPGGLAYVGVALALCARWLVVRPVLAGESR